MRPNKWNNTRPIKAYVVSYGKDRPLMMRYRDPATGKRIAISSGTYDKEEAEREAAKWEQKLNAQHIFDRSPALCSKIELSLDTVEQLVLAVHFVIDQFPEDSDIQTAFSSVLSELKRIA